MFKVETRRTAGTAAFSLLDLIYHSTVRSIRKQHSNAVVGLVSNILQTLAFMAVFYVMFSIFGLRRLTIRGDFIVYIMSGVFLFMTNVKTMKAVISAEGPTSAIMLHAPMNTTVAICAAALSALYSQFLSVIAILGVYRLVAGPFEIQDPLGAFAMFVLAWANGISVGLVFLAARPWWPGFVGIANTVYTRANMIASGKMFVANMLNAKMLLLFGWNPLFHIIDQARGFAFVNYNPHHTSVAYPVIVSLALVTLGLVGEFYTRKHASLSWTAGK